MAELKRTLRQLKNKKSPGPDGITNEMLKHLSNTTTELEGSLTSGTCKETCWMWCDVSIALQLITYSFGPICLLVCLCMLVFLHSHYLCITPLCRLVAELFGTLSCCFLLILVLIYLHLPSAHLFNNNFHG